MSTGGATTTGGGQQHSTHHRRHVLFMSDNECYIDNTTSTTTNNYFYFRKGEKRMCFIKSLRSWKILGRGMFLLVVFLFFMVCVKVSYMAGCRVTDVTNNGKLILRDYNSMIKAQRILSDIDHSSSSSSMPPTRVLEKYYKYPVSNTIFL